MKVRSLHLKIIALFSLFSCEMKPKVVEEDSSLLIKKSYVYDPSVSLDFNGEYFSGEAQILVYELQKARYDSIHNGEAILVQVVEPFLYKEQVKNDQGEAEGSLNILKSNYFERFSTGVYDYALMTSTFTPLRYDTLQHSIKITSSIQDWCGQTLLHLNNRGVFNLQMNSYFQKEGDSTFEIDRTWQEDEIMNLIRLSEAVLPLDNFKILPKTAFLSTNHITPKSYGAFGQIKNEMMDTLALKVYSISIPELKRTVRYYYDPSRENLITKIEEEYPTVFDGKIRKSTAILKSSQKMPYWELNAPSNKKLRKKMGLK